MTTRLPPTTASSRSLVRKGPREGGPLRAGSVTHLRGTWTPSPRVRKSSRSTPLGADGVGRDRARRTGSFESSMPSVRLAGSKDQASLILRAHRRDVRDLHAAQLDARASASRSRGTPMQPFRSAESTGDLFAVALHRRFGGEDLSSEVLGIIGLRREGVGLNGRRVRAAPHQRTRRRQPGACRDAMPIAARRSPLIRSTSCSRCELKRHNSSPGFEHSPDPPMRTSVSRGEQVEPRGDGPWGTGGGPHLAKSPS